MSKIIEGGNAYGTESKSLYNGTLQRVIEVDIDKIEDSIEYAREQYFSEKIILDSSDLVDTEFEMCE